MKELNDAERKAIRVLFYKIQNDASNGSTIFTKDVGRIILQSIMNKVVELQKKLQ